MIIHPLLVKKTATFQTKTINPSITEQTYTPDTGKDGFSSVTVKAVDNTIDANIQAGYIKEGVTILGVTGTFEGSATDQPTAGKSSIVINATAGGRGLAGVTVTITNTEDSSVRFTGTTDANGRFYQQVNAGTYTVSVSDNGDYITPDAQTIEASINEANYCYMVYRTLSVTYGVKIDLANSNPETSVTYTDDAVGFDKSYMDFANDTFVYGSWQDKFPFNQVRPCLFKDGAVVKYLNPDNYAKDVDGNDVVITGADGDVMIEIPKVYYRLHKDENYQYIQISDTAQEGFCCLAHTYKGVEKDKVYIGAYQSYYDGAKSRSVSGVSATGSKSLNNWRDYAHAQGEGYETFYWNLLVLLQCLYTIQFKNLNSQEALGYGWANNSSAYSTGGGLNAKGMYYGTAATGQVKFMGIEDFYGSRNQWIDGAYINGTSLTVADATSPDMAFNGTGVGYKTAASGLTTGSGYFTKIVGENNEAGFTPQNFSGSASTYYCDYGYVNSGYVPYFGGSRTTTAHAGAFYCNFYNTASNTYAFRCSRLAFCG